MVKPAAFGTAKSPSGSYHHGDLRQALIDAAVAALEVCEVHEISVIKLARGANVSAGAPYHHFRDKSELLALVAREGFEKLLSELARTDQVDSEPACRVAAYISAYVSFARRHRGYYKVMFLGEVTRPDNISHVEEPAHGCFEYLVNLMHALKVVNERSAIDCAIQCWSLVHGLLVLYETGPLPLKIDPEKLEELAISGVLTLAGFESRRSA